MAKSHSEPPGYGKIAEIRSYIRGLNWKPFLAYNNSPKRPKYKIYVQNGCICFVNYFARIRCSDGEVVTANNQIAPGEWVIDLYKSPIIQQNHVEPRLLLELLKLQTPT